MGTRPYSPITIELLEDKYLIRLLRKLIIPLMRWRILKTHRFIDVFENTVTADDEIGGGDAGGGGNAERVFVDCFDRTPCLCG